jgi:hypothetical protein
MPGISPLARWSPADVPGSGWRKLSSTTWRPTTPIAVMVNAVPRVTVLASRPSPPACRVTVLMTGSQRRASWLLRAAPRDGGLPFEGSGMPTPYARSPRTARVLR